MSNVIDFLERMGQDAKLSHASRSEMQFALQQANIVSDAHLAILNMDQHELEVIVGANSNVCCAIFPVEDDAGEDSER